MIAASSIIIYTINKMSKFEETPPLRLNVINKHNNDLRISIIVGGHLTISQLKRKIQHEFHQLYSLEVVVRVIEDSSGFIISNNSVVGEHFANNDTILFSQHQEKTGSNMNLTSNLTDILQTLRYVCSSVMEKLDKIDLTHHNVVGTVSQILHLTFWYAHEEVVQKVFKVMNKIFGPDSTDIYMEQCSELQHNILMRSISLWLMEVQNTQEQMNISWEIIQLLEKLTLNNKFIAIIKTHKIMKVIGEMSKDSLIPNEMKKTAVRILKNINGGKSGGMGQKIKSAYIPSIMSGSSAMGYDLNEILQLLGSHSQDEKINAIEFMSESNFQLVFEATVRFQHYEKLTNVFTIRKMKNRKHITLINQIINSMAANTSNEKAIHIMQKDILKKVHQFLLQTPTELHSSTNEYLKKVVKATISSGMFNVEKATELINSPYPYFQKLMVDGISSMSENLTKISSIRFIPGIRDCIKLCLKTSDQTISRDLLRMFANLTLDEQCRYQLLNLKGIQIFVKFMETSKNNQICRICAKGLLNLTISSRQTKVKVLGQFDKILDRFYEGAFDSVTNGFIETILKSKNV